MAFKRLIESRESGNVIVMTLIVLMVLSVLGAAILGVAGMENKVSHAAVEAMQAQQAADAGVEWAIEDLWRLGLVETLTDELNLDNGIHSVINVTDRTQVIGEGGHLECTYVFTSSGVCQGITRRLEVEVVYVFSDLYPANYDSVEIRSYKVIP